MPDDRNIEAAPSQDPKWIQRLNPPPEGQTLRGWCLYQDDRWEGPVPQEYDDKGWIVYPDKAMAYRGLAREMRQRCDGFESGEIIGEFLSCSWYPHEVTYLPNGNVLDSTGAEFDPRYPWGG